MLFNEFCDQLRGAHAVVSAGVPENLVMFRQVDSTNLLARRVLEDAKRDGTQIPETLIVAFEQSRGRGRGEHSWASPPGVGIYSTLLMPLPATTGLRTMPLLVGVGLCRALQPHLQHRVGLKWPNDLMVRGRKLGGILIEAVSAEEETQMAIIGYGINHAQSESELPLPTATSVAVESAAPPPMTELLLALALAVEHELAQLDDTDYAIDAYRELSVHQPGDQLSCRIGKKVVSGEFAGFDEHGQLRLSTAGGETLLAAGDLIETS